MIAEKDILNAYAHGIFPMADAKDDLEFYWVKPELRGQLPILNLHIPARLQRTVLAAPYDIKINQNFEAVIDGCTNARADTWINTHIRDVFIRLHQQGLAHSVEAYQDDRLVGGLYGLALGSTFCGESMFSLVRDASKIALVHLCARLWRTGFKILDAQFVNEHLRQFGIFEVPQADYVAAMQKGLADLCPFMGVVEDEKMLVTSYITARAVV